MSAVDGVGSAFENDEPVSADRYRALLAERDAWKTESEDWQAATVRCREAYLPLLAERDRLRAALERIADETAATWVADVARTALSQPGGGTE